MPENNLIRVRALNNIPEFRLSNTDTKCPDELRKCIQTVQSGKVKAKMRHDRLSGLLSGSLSIENPFVGQQERQKPLTASAADQHSMSG